MQSMPKFRNPGKGSDNPGSWRGTAQTCTTSAACRTAPLPYTSASRAATTPSRTCCCTTTPPLSWRTREVRHSLKTCCAVAAPSTTCVLLTLQWSGGDPGSPTLHLLRLMQGCKPQWKMRVSCACAEEVAALWRRPNAHRCGDKRAQRVPDAQAGDARAVPGHDAHEGAQVGRLRHRVAPAVRRPPSVLHSHGLLLLLLPRC